MRPGLSILPSILMLLLRYCFWQRWTPWRKATRKCKTQVHETQRDMPLGDGVRANSGWRVLSWIPGSKLAQRGIATSWRCVEYGKLSRIGSPRRPTCWIRTWLAMCSHALRLLLAKYPLEWSSEHLDANVPPTETRNVESVGLDLLLLVLMSMITENLSQTAR